MTELKHLSGFVDFEHPAPLLELASVLSVCLFAGIAFVGGDEGNWDEVPALRLENDFLGLRVELGGEPGEAGGYTLQVQPVEFPWELIESGKGHEIQVDLSGYLSFLLERVEGVKLRPPSF